MAAAITLITVSALGLLINGATLLRGILKLTRGRSTFHDIQMIGACYVSYDRNDVKQCMYVETRTSMRVFPSVNHYPISSRA
jgi:hypothetical protein